MILGKCRSCGISLDGMKHIGSDIRLTGHTASPSSACPCCGKRSHRIHSYRWRHLQLTEELSCHVTLLLRVRHFYCGNPSCQRKVFSEPLSFAARYGRMSHEAASRIRSESLSQPARAFLSHT